MIWYEAHYLYPDPKTIGNVIRKMQMGEGRGSKQIDAMLSAKGRGTLLSYRPCMVDEIEVNAAGKLDTRSESRKRAFDHHDTLETWMPGAVVMGLFCTYLPPIQVVTIVKAQTGCYDIQYWRPFILCPMRSNIHRPDFLVFTVKFNSYVSSVMH